MFCFVTPNGSVDLTFRQLESPADRQAEAELLAETAGGKGHNAARTLVALGNDARALGFAGGWVGSRMAELLTRDGVDARLTPIAGCNRLFVTIADPHGRRRVSYHLAGPRVTPSELGELLDEVRRCAHESDIVVIAGAPPPGMDASWLTEAVRALPKDRCIVDTSGPALLGALAGPPGTVKLNQAELGSLGYAEAKTSLRGVARAIAVASERFEVGDWWITLGRKGAVVSTGGRLLRARGVTVAMHNTSGAGDGFLAGMLHGRAAGEDVEGQASWAVAASAAVCEQVAPLPPSPARVAELRDEVVIEEIRVSAPRRALTVPGGDRVPLAEMPAHARLLRD
ncbi:MAG: PfkB family carbohydrate kinase [Acidimicrobiales bacterium]